MQSDDKQSSTDSSSNNISCHGGKHSTAGWHLILQAALLGWILLVCCSSVLGERSVSLRISAFTSHRNDPLGSQTKTGGEKGETQ